MASQVEAAYHAAVEDLRDLEYPMLKDSIYLDHAASTPSPKSLMDAFAAEMTSTLYGNPHSASWPSQLSATRIDDVRLSLLGFFNADPAEYDLVFVANATAGVKLVVEAMRSLPNGYVYAYHQACHTSLVGAREDARSSTCLDDSGVQSWLDGVDPFDTAPQAPSARLFSFSAQSHMDGRRYPLSWPRDLQDRTEAASPRLYTLLDAASLGATSQLHLGSPVFAADFTLLSLYKIFGFPELGVIIIRRSAEPERWHVRKTQSLHERLEDGTLPFQSIMAIDAALKVHKKLFGSMNNIAAHTSYLAIKLRDGLRSLRHGNGRPVCVMYNATAEDREGQGIGPVVSFNIVNGAGGWVSLAEFEKLAILRNMHVRTGGLCCPGGIASTLGLEPWELKRNLSAGYRCGTESDIMTGKPHGVIRASLGAMSIASDVDSFTEFVREFFVEGTPPPPDINLDRSTKARNSRTLRVKAMTVYPIKSCGGFVIPPGLRWGVRAEGLAWDREWCLVHRGSGQALSQKRYPNMALLRPVLDLERGIMRVVFHGPSQESKHPYVEIPLSANPALSHDKSRQMAPRVCGEQVYAQAYVSNEMNDFFANALGVPCVLARLQKHQRVAVLRSIPGSFPDVPSPPDSDSEQQQQTRILLSNESPILLVHSSSVDALNYDIKSRGGDAVAESTFRANIIVESLPGGLGEPAYSEDTWSRIRIGDEDFKLLGACRRCQMVCVDQVTAERRQEPLTTLAKTRRFDSKVYFGAHMRHEPGDEGHGPPSLPPTIEVGEPVLVYDGHYQ
ncbi:MOSC domain-containing protein [Hirsutella rhossiliensis]|uniref:Molybdenum cofactor sulfurase n=1 Tax=Hirsutella rhossiliensis TaxID=111463 RepID=A0A9P8SMY3_9HYPO|nr:MOSC domain-containing protein [Hirsutella rhossiliensis]KAH0967340.1 MOSC domain-containing protein [Hirsutella rhossiliensis]